MSRKSEQVAGLKHPPAAAELGAHLSTFELLLPALLPVKPVAGPTTSKSSRLRSRLKRRLGIWSGASAYVATLNALDQGKCKVKTTVSFSRSWSAGHEQALAQLHSSALREAVRLERGTCGGPTGVASLAALLRTSAIDNYSIRGSTKSQVAMCADAIDEPDHEVVVPLLDALSPENAEYYKLESNVVELEGKSVVLAQELEAQYGFAGGTESEYIRYFHRPLPSNMSHWGVASEVRAIACFSVVPKNDHRKQRQLLMQCVCVWPTIGGPIVTRGKIMECSVGHYWRRYMLRQAA